MNLFVRRLETLLFLAISCPALAYGQPVRDIAFYVEAARLRSPLVVDNKNQVLANGLEAERLRAFYTKPQVSLIGAAQIAPILDLDGSNPKLVLNPNEATRYRGYDLAVSNGGLYQGLLNVNQPISNLIRAKAYALPIALASQVSQAVISLAEHDVERLVIDQYILCQQDQLQVIFSDSLLSLLDNQHKVLKKLAEASLIKQSELSLLEVEIANQQSILVQYRTAYRRDVLELAALAGLADTTVPALAPLELQLRATVPEGESGFTSRYRFDSLALDAQQTIFNLRYKPQWVAFANTGLNSSYLPQIQNRAGFSTGIGLTWNLYDGHQQRFAFDRTRLLQKSLSTYRSYTITQNATRKARTLAELAGLDERAKVLARQQALYMKILASYRSELMAGQLPILNYILVLRNMMTAQRDLKVLQGSRQLLINAYNYYNW